MDTLLHAGRPLKIADLKLDQRIKHSVYEKKLLKLQINAVKAQRLVVDRRMRVVLVFEGMDAAGKGGAIKRMTQYLDPRGLEVHAIGAPNTQELTHHYLRRFWLRLPSRGRIGIFDRSWYGRMLVEPIEGYCSDIEYKRSAKEIRRFEKMLARDEYLILKFWLHIDKDEQLRRFESRQDDPLKKWKLTKEDWRNRAKFEDYVKHANRMFKETDAPHAPWILISGNNKKHARLAILDTVVDAVLMFADQGKLKQ